MKNSSLFPSELDGAEVMYHTDKGNYEIIRYETGKAFDTVCYYAIAKYRGDDSYYLFGCNEKFEVISDFPFGSIEECKRACEIPARSLSWQDSHENKE